MRILGVMGFAATLMVSASAASAQTEIKVTAIGTASALHDTFATYVRVETDVHANRTVALGKGNQIALKLKSQLEMYGLGSDDFRIDPVYVYREWDSTSKKPIGHKATVGARVSYLFSNEKGDEIAKLLIDGYKSGQPESTVSDEAMREARSAARVEAAENAAEMARAHAHGANCKLGPIVSVTEGGDNDRGYGSASRSASASVGSSLVTDTEAVGRSSQVSVRVTYVFLCGRQS